MAYKIRVATKNQEDKVPEEIKPQPTKPPPQEIIKGIAIIVIIFCIFFGLMMFFGASSNNDNNQNGGGGSQGGNNNVYFVKVVVDYPYHWSGSRSWGWSTTESVESYGYGSWYGNVTEGQYVGAVIQKMSGGYDELTVSIISDGVVVNTASTTAEYGVVTVSWIVE